jgi:hypothetical protein
VPRPGGRAATFGIERQTAIGAEFDGQVRRWDRWDRGRWWRPPLNLPLLEPSRQLHLRRKPVDA